MHNIKNYYKNVIKYDLINKFFYEKTIEIPRLHKVSITFSCKTGDLKEIASSFLALELIARQKPKITTIKKSNLLLKLRNGHPIGCKVTLRKNKMLNFVAKVLIDILPRLKNFQGFDLKKIHKTNSSIFSFKLNEMFSFPELENHFYLFNNLTSININIILKSSIKQELTFVLESIKLLTHKNKQI